ncbi:MAG: aminotransferase class IV [Sphaerochaeta sp.]|uniref:aminotransferase class IV n=1 Tax=Sphaerochaeta sp. TaxID=1972642 RepID=UPI002977CA78|nr:aminotransferase class IV [Sphaerochaeta sp.]MDD3928716.1 aminotransferase class IV [Sphaerochaeta sp.]
MVGEHAIHNMRVIARKDAVVPITLRAVQFGFSTYESLRIIEGKVVHLQDHLNRLEHSCKGIGLVHPFTHEQITDSVHRLMEVDAIGQASLRIQIYGGEEPQLFVTASTILSYPETQYTQGVGAISYYGERLFPSCKTGNLLLNYLAVEEAKRQKCFEALLVDRTGRVLEGTRSNFFALKENSLYTAADDEVLLGITRDRVIKAAVQLGLSVVYEAPYLEDLAMGTYGQAFISATSMAAMPLASLDGKSFSAPFTKILAIRDLVRSWELQD